MPYRNLNYSVVYENLIKEIGFYLINNQKRIIVGISGGIDSALNTVIARGACEYMVKAFPGVKIPIIGRYIGIESNKPEEKERADSLGKLFCTDYKDIDLTDQYNVLKDSMETVELDEKSLKIANGNIKARLRMIYLRDLAQKHDGILLDNDNQTEYQLGFWTLDGDVGDIVPLEQLWKTEVYELANYVCENILTDVNEKAALKACIDAVPTDGLGITNSDLDQLGAKSYEEVDDILQQVEQITSTQTYYNSPEIIEKNKERLFVFIRSIKDHSIDTVYKIYKRHMNSNFKRKGKVVMKPLNNFKNAIN